MGESVTMPDLIRMRELGEKITMLTAYDYTFAKLFDEAGVECLLVGDSLGTVIQGNENTLSVTLEEIIYHTKLVVRGASRALVIADMPFMSYQLGAREALESAGRLVKEGGAQVVKLEGGSNISESVSAIVSAGIPVIGHIGLTPQSVNKFGGHRVQGKTENDATRIIEDAKALELAGVGAVVLEGIPAPLAKRVTESIQVPTIGIGAGKECSGQVLVGYDFLGLTSFAEGKSPKFVKDFSGLGDKVKEATINFIDAVKNGEFPGREHSYFPKKSKDQSLVIPIVKRA